MNTKKRSSDEGGVAVMSRRAPSRRSRRLMIAGAIVAALVAGACFFVWQHVRDRVLAASQYQVLAQHISVTAPPDWVRADVKAEVLRDLNRSGPLSLLDEDLTVRLAGGFSGHPWVARVDRVSKHFPSGVDVIVAYRVPVAMVELHDGTGVLPVDEQGVVLPTRGRAGEPNFTADEAERYPRIGEIHTLPAGPVGTRWGDAGVLGGAQIAAALSGDWTALDLARIVPWERKRARSGVEYEYTFALVTHSGTTVLWGRAPGTEENGEVPAGEKIAQLKRYALQNGGTLDGPDGPHKIKIDGRGALLQIARPVVEPLPRKDE
ncbi:MAG: hypothetical protein WD063_12260 [Pirellulales bacterium]